MKAEKQYRFVNVDYINELVLGDDEFVKELAETFLNTIPPGLERLKAASSTRDYTDLKFIAHKLKGSFNFMGCPEQGGLFAVIDQYSTDATKYDLIPELVTKAIDSAELVLGEYKEFAEECRGV